MDALIVGAGPAGCAAAYDLARAGRRVLLLDRRSFPRPKACACGLTRKTLKALRYSVAPVTERVCHEIVLQNGPPSSGGPSMTASPSWVGSGAPSSTGSLIAGQGGVPSAGEVRVRTRHPICAMAVRERFDAFCLEQTLAVGATLRKIEHIAALRELPTHIELDIVTAAGPETLRAPVLIGADGSNGQTRRLSEALDGPSSLAAPSSTGGRIAGQGGVLSGLAWKGTGFSPSVNAPANTGAFAPEGTPAGPVWYTHGFALEATVPYADLPATLPGGDAPHDLVFDFSPLPGGYGWLFPKGDHINIGVGAFAPSTDATGGPLMTTASSSSWVGSHDARLKQVTRTLLAHYAAHKLGVRELKHITGQHLGMGGHAYVPRGRVLLTGDAAGLCDPITGEGIHSAVVSGQAAAAAILDVLPPTSELALKGTGFSPSVDVPANRGAFTPEGNLAAAYARHLRPLQQTLTFSHRAARAFYAEPERGFRAMRTPLLRSLILKTYADGLPWTGLIAAAMKGISVRKSVGSDGP